MSIDEETLLRIAHLSRLDFPPEALAQMQRDLSRIIAYAEQLATLDLDDIPPTTHPLSPTLRLRKDIPHPHLSRAVALQNAPATEEGYFLVPKIITSPSNGGAAQATRRVTPEEPSS